MPKGKHNPMNLTIDTQSILGGNVLRPPNNDRLKFPLSSPITEEISSPEHSSSESNSANEKSSRPKLVGATLSNTTTANADGDGDGETGLSKTEFERALYANLAQARKLETSRNMATTISNNSLTSSNNVNIVKQQNKRKSGFFKKSQRPVGLQLMTTFSEKNNPASEEDNGNGYTFVDLNDLKSMAKARESERSGDRPPDYYASTQTLQQPLPTRTSELSPSDRPIVIGLTVPYNEPMTPHGETIDSAASSRTPATPSIVITPARENSLWDMDMSTSPEMLHQPRVASSVYSQHSPRLFEEDVPPVPAIPALHSMVNYHQNGSNHDVDQIFSPAHSTPNLSQQERPVSTNTEFEVEEPHQNGEKSLSPNNDDNDSSNINRKKFLHKLSVNTTDANRHRSQGWWTYLLSPLLSRSSSMSSRRTALSPSHPHMNPPLSATSFKTLSPPIIEEEESSGNWWDEKEVMTMPEKSHFSPDTPEDQHALMNRDIPNIDGAWDVLNADEKSRNGNPNTRSVFQTGNVMVPNFDLHGAAAEYYQASAHDLYSDEPYFECVDHVCSMTSAKRRAEFEAAQKALAEKLEADGGDEKRRVAILAVFDPSGDPNNPFITFVEQRIEDKEVGEEDGDDEEHDKEEKEEEGEGADKEMEIEKEEEEEEEGEAEKEEEKHEAVMDDEHANGRGRDLVSVDGDSEGEAPEDGPVHIRPRSIRESPDMGAPRSVASPLPSYREPSPPPPASADHSSRGVGFAPVNYEREMMPEPEPAPAPAPRAWSPPPPSVRMPMMPPEPAPAPAPRAWSPPPPSVHMPMMPPAPARTYTPEPVSMPMPAPVPARAPSPEPVRMPMPRPTWTPEPESDSEPEPVRMPSPTRPPPTNAPRTRGIPSGYDWEPVPVPRTMTPPRPTRIPSPPMPPREMSPEPARSRVVVDEPDSESEHEPEPEPAPLPRPAPSFHRPGPFSAFRRNPQSRAPPPPPQESPEDFEESESESELPPYSAAPTSRDASRSRGLPTYSARGGQEQHEPISPGLQQIMARTGGLPMSEVSQSTRSENEMSMSRGEPRTIINVNHYYGDNRDELPPRPGNHFVPAEADFQAREENEAKRQRLEKEDSFAKKLGGLWRGRGCIPDKGCFGRGGREGRVRRRWYAAVIIFCMAVVIISVSLATTLTHKGDSTPVQSQWLNLTGYPPMPTGIMTVAGPAPAVERSSCIAPTQAWSCALPKEQQASNAGGYAADLPNFRIEIRFRNNTYLSSNSTSSGSNSTTTYSKRKSLSIFDRRDSWDASPDVPRLVDQIFLGNTTDNVTTPFQGEDTPFYITFLAPYDTTNLTQQNVKRDTSSDSTATIPTSTSSFLSMTTTSSSTGTGTSTSSSDYDLNSIIPAPAIATDGTAAAATLYPLPISQPVKLYNRGLSTEHYGFYTYFDKSIFLASNATVTGGSTDTNSDDSIGGSAESEASVRCTWSQTRFLVQIWTQPQNVSHMILTASSNTTTNSSTSTSTSTSATTSTSTSSSHQSTSTSASSSSANNFTSPGSFPYPITITIDRHGGLATEKLAYCYGIDQQTSSNNADGSVAGAYYNLTSPKLEAEDRSSGGSIVNPSPGYLILAEAISQNVPEDEISPVDGGTGGCMCEWRNWVQTV